MQPIIDQLRAATGGNLGFIIGCILLGLLALQLLLMLYVSLRRVYFDREQRRLSRQRLQLLIKAAQAQCQEVEQAKLLWNGSRKFTVMRKVRECQDVFSFYLAPHDGKPLPAYRPGQYLTFQLDVPGRDKPVVRCYSLSDSPNHPDYYRITIKKEKAPADRPELPPGVASCYFCDVAKEGDILNVKAPAGHFYLDMAKANPIMLIAGGVGVTPMLSMARAVAASGMKREVWFIFGVRNGDEHIFKQDLEKLAANHENIRVQVFYSRPKPDEVKGRDYHREGRVTIEALKELVPSNNYEYYLCGNGSFMKSLTDGLEAWGVPEKDIYFEAFGPATVKKKSTPTATAAMPGAPLFQVTFSKTGKVLTWEPGLANLLDFARANGVRIDSGCCAGSCGSCVVAIKSGSIDYLKPPDAEPEQGTCLTCICKPKADLVLDA